MLPLFDYFCENKSCNMRKANFLLGAYLLFPITGTAQYLYSYDARGNLVSVRNVDAAWKVLSLESEKPVGGTVDSTHINISYDVSTSCAIISVSTQRDTLVNVTLYNMANGLAVARKSFVGKRMEYELSSLARGFYVLEVICMEEKKTLKIIK